MEERVTTAGIALNCGHVLIAKREKGGALSGKWEFPGGKNRYGESEEETDTALRYFYDILSDLSDCHYSLSITQEDDRDCPFRFLRRLN